MAYPTVSFQPTSQTIGSQPIGLTSTTQNHALGAVITAKDITYGEGEFIYLKGVASTAAGDVVCYDSQAATTVRAVADGATSTGPIAIAMAANVASQYGWYQVSGSGPANAATASANTQAHLSATAGQVDDATGTPITGMLIKAATSSGFATVQLNRPSVSPESAGSNSGDVTLSAFGTTGDAKGATLTGQALALQAATATQPGLIKASGSQTLAPAITFAAAPISANGFHAVAGAAGGLEFDSTEVYVRAPNAGGEVHFTSLAGTEYARATSSGITFSSARTVTFPYTDSSGTPGAATINKATGRSAIASGVASVTITSSVCTTTSVVLLAPEDLDTTLLTWKVAPGNGSFVVTGVAAATANWKFRWVILKGE